MTELILAEPRSWITWAMNALGLAVCLAAALYGIFRVARAINLAAQASRTVRGDWRWTVILGWWSAFTAVFVWLIFLNVFKPEPCKVLLSRGFIKVEYIGLRPDLRLPQGDVVNVSYRVDFAGIRKLARTRRPSIVIRTKGNGRDIILVSHSHRPENFQRWKNAVVAIERWLEKSNTDPT